MQSNFSLLSGVLRGDANALVFTFVVVRRGGGRARARLRARQGAAAAQLAALALAHRARRPGAQRRAAARAARDPRVRAAEEALLGGGHAQDHGKEGEDARTALRKSRHIGFT